VRQLGVTSGSTVDDPSEHQTDQACQPTFDSHTPLAGTETLTGVGFFDKKERQQGIAPNGIEFHPVLSSSSSDCYQTGAHSPVTDEDAGRRPPAED
jgi:hypothetical protein